MQNVYLKVNPQQNTVCLEQQIYANTKNYTPALLVMLETFRSTAPLLLMYLKQIIEWWDFKLNNNIPAVPRGTIVVPPGNLLGTPRVSLGTSGVPLGRTLKCPDFTPAGF